MLLSIRDEPWESEHKRHVPDVPVQAEDWLFHQENLIDMRINQHIYMRASRSRSRSRDGDKGKQEELKKNKYEDSDEDDPFGVEAERRRKKEQMAKILAAYKND